MQQQALPDSDIWGTSWFQEWARCHTWHGWPVTARLCTASVASQLQAFMDELRWWQVWLCFHRSQPCCPASGLNLLQLIWVFAEPEAVTCCWCLHLLFANCLMPPVYLTWYSNWDQIISTIRKVGNKFPSQCGHKSTDTIVRCFVAEGALYQTCQSSIGMAFNSVSSERWWLCSIL